MDAQYLFPGTPYCIKNRDRQTDRQMTGRQDRFSDILLIMAMRGLHMNSINHNKNTVTLAHTIFVVACRCYRRSCGRTASQPAATGQQCMIHNNLTNKELLKHSILLWRFLVHSFFQRISDWKEWTHVHCPEQVVSFLCSANIWDSSAEHKKRASRLFKLLPHSWVWRFSLCSWEI